MLITAAEFRGWYPLLSGASEDTAVETVIDAVGTHIARVCGYPRTDAGTWTLEAATYTRYYDGPSRRSARCLDLGIWPVVSITSAHADPDWDYASDTLVASGDLTLDGDRGLLWIDPNPTGSAAAWVEAPRGNKVVMSAGYGTVPDDLKWLCAQAVRHAWDRRRVQGQTQHQMSGDSTTIADSNDVLPEAVRRGLHVYTLVPR